MGSAARGLPVGVPADATLLVSGPPMTGRYDLMHRLLGAHASAGLFISTAHDATTVVEDFGAASGVGAGRVAVVECTGGDPGEETDRVKYGSADNLTQLGVKFTELFERFYEDGPETVGVGVHSLSTLLMHADVETVYQFLQVLTGQVRSVDWPCVAVVNDGAVDAEALATLKHHFDGVLRTRVGENGRELRVRGLDPTASEWTPF
jgi:KaiC/GvpD/RAD55 family RecA-like ATPase